ncbi:hypothetical protein CGCSCA1_v000871 [Colletotrichum siamense]|nr:hypothetical protein CGCSCA1_v000871 [Colletotrichum siamense]
MANSVAEEFCSADGDVAVVEPITQRQRLAEGEKKGSQKQGNYRLALLVHGILGHGPIMQKEILMFSPPDNNSRSLSLRPCHHEWSHPSSRTCAKSGR